MSASLNFWFLNHYAGNDELGMEFRHAYLAKHLVGMGHRVGIVAASFHHLRDNHIAPDGPVTFREYEGIPYAFVRTPRYEGNGLRRLANTMAYSVGVARRRRRLEKELGRPNVVLASSPHPFVALNLLGLGKRYGATTLFEVRDLWPQVLVELGALGPRHPLTRVFAALERKAYREADRVLSLWHSADRYMFEHGLDPERYVYLPNGIELTVADAEPDADIVDHPLVRHVRELRESGVFVVGYAGSHGFANALDLMLDSASLLEKRGIEDVRLVLVGDGPAKQALVERATEAGIGTIHFHDFVPKPVAMAFYRSVDMCFIALEDLPVFRYGPTPNKLMDYFAAARPVLFAIRSDYDPVGEAGAGLSIAPGDPAAVVDAIQHLKARPGHELDAMGAAGRAYAERELDFAVLAHRLLDAALEAGAGAG